MSDYDAQWTCRFIEEEEKHIQENINQKNIKYNSEGEGFNILKK